VVVVVPVLVVVVLRVVRAVVLIAAVVVRRAVPVCAGAKPSPAWMLATGSATVSLAIR
jgi:hypothetical protein